MNDSLSEYRRLRFLGIAVFDSTLTIILVFIIHTLSWFYIVSAKNKTPLMYIFSFIILFMITILISIIAHMMFGIKTALLSYLGLSRVPDILL